MMMKKSLEETLSELPLEDLEHTLEINASGVVANLILLEGRKRLFSNLLSDETLVDGMDLLEDVMFTFLMDAVSATIQAHHQVGNSEEVRLLVQSMQYFKAKQRFGGDLKRMKEEFLKTGKLLNLSEKHLTPTEEQVASFMATLEKFGKTYQEKGRAI